MNIIERGARSSLILTGIVIALAGAIGFMLPLLSSTGPGGIDKAAEAWLPPNRTSTATTAAESSLATPDATIEAMASGNSGSKIAFVVLDTATPSTPPQPARPVATAVLSPPSPASQDSKYQMAVNPSAVEAATPLVVDVPRREERKSAATSENPDLSFMPALTVGSPATLSVPIPLARGPNDGLLLAQAGAQPRLTATAIPATTSAPALLPTPSAASQAAGESTRAAAPTPRLVSPADTAQPPAPPSLPTAQPSHEVQLAPPELISPPADARLSGIVTFEWRPVSVLARGSAYEIVVWSPDQDPNQARGIMPAALVTSQVVNLDRLFESGQFRTGNLYWTVLVVQREPYLRLTTPGESEARYMVRRSGG